jgi:mRNA-degrading endonuclease toxin of MazEF toxin-antitoxin module
MPVESVVSLDDMLIVPKSALTGQIVGLSEQRMAEVDKAILFALDISV